MRVLACDRPDTVQVSDTHYLSVGLRPLRGVARLTVSEYLHVLFAPLSPLLPGTMSIMADTFESISQHHHARNIPRTTKRWNMKDQDSYSVWHLELVGIISRATNKHFLGSTAPAALDISVGNSVAERTRSTSAQPELSANAIQIRIRGPSL